VPVPEENEGLTSARAVTSLDRPTVSDSSPRRGARRRSQSLDIGSFAACHLSHAWNFGSLDETRSTSSSTNCDARIPPTVFRMIT
jgi:hypothetical protein